MPAVLFVTALQHFYVKACLAQQPAHALAALSAPPAMNGNLPVRGQALRRLYKTGHFGGGEVQTKQKGRFFAFLLVGNTDLRPFFVAEQREGLRSGYAALGVFAGRTYVQQYAGFFFV